MGCQMLWRIIHGERANGRRKRRPELRGHESCRHHMLGMVCPGARCRAWFGHEGRHTCRTFRTTGKALRRSALQACAKQFKRDAEKETRAMEGGPAGVKYQTNHGKEMVLGQDSGVASHENGAGVTGLGIWKWGDPGAGRVAAGRDSRC